MADLAVMLAGYLTEKMIFDDITTGASNDLKRATQLAQEMVKNYAMGPDLRTFGQRDELIFLGKEIHEEKDYSEKTAEKIDQEINKLLEKGKQTAEDILLKHRNMLDKISEELMEKETIEKEAFADLFKDVKVPKKKLYKK
jgi:cell division protease FtsH